MSLTYKNYFIRYRIEDGKVVVTSAIADWNFTCSNGGETFDSVDDLKRAIDNGLWAIGRGKW